MEKVAKQKVSTQDIMSALSEETEIGFTKTKVTSCFENLFIIVQSNYTSRISNLLKINSDAKNCPFGVDS